MVVVTDVDHTYYHDDSLAPGREAVRTTYTKDTVRAALLGGAGTDDDICLSAIVPSSEAPSGEFYDLVNETGGILMKSRTDWGEELTSDLAEKIALETKAKATITTEDVTKEIIRTPPISEISQL